MTFENVTGFSNYTLDIQIKNNTNNYVRCVTEVQTRQC